jgi:hypothetical protein
MNRRFLESIRLTHYFVLLLVVYFTGSLLVDDIKFESGALTLFSVNSFLYGFYIAPILSGQKARIEELHKIVRAEANAIFAMAISMKKLPKDLRNKLQDMLIEYLKLSIRQRRANEGEEAYEALISYCVEYTGDHTSEIDKLLDKLVANQQNRTNFTMQMRNKVYNNEWMIMLVLFTITLGFVFLLDAGNGVTYDLLSSFLCTGLTMLLIILLKMSTLTHKKATQVWDPYKKLIRTRFYRID